MAREARAAAIAAAKGATPNMDGLMRKLLVALQRIPLRGEERPEERRARLGVEERGLACFISIRGD